MVVVALVAVASVNVHHCKSQGQRRESGSLEKKRPARRRPSRRGSAPSGVSVPRVVGWMRRWRLQTASEEALLWVMAVMMGTETSKASGCGELVRRTRRSKQRGRHTAKERTRGRDPSRRCRLALSTVRTRATRCAQLAVAEPCGTRCHDARLRRRRQLRLRASGSTTATTRSERRTGGRET